MITNGLGLRLVPQGGNSEPAREYSHAIGVAPYPRDSDVEPPIDFYKLLGRCVELSHSPRTSQGTHAVSVHTSTVASLVIALLFRFCALQLGYSTLP